MWMFSKAHVVGQLSKFMTTIPRNMTSNRPGVQSDKTLHFPRRFLSRFHRSSVLIGMEEHPHRVTHICPSLQEAFWKKGFLMRGTGGKRRTITLRSGGAALSILAKGLLEKMVTRWQ